MRDGDQRDTIATTQISIFGRRIAVQARRIGKSPATLYRMIRRCGLPATLVGGTWFIKDEDVDKFFRERTAARLGKPVPAASSKAFDDADRALSRRVGDPIFHVGEF